MVVFPLPKVEGTAARNGNGCPPLPSPPPPRKQEHEQEQAYPHNNNNDNNRIILSKYELEQEEVGGWKLQNSRKKQGRGIMMKIFERDSKNHTRDLVVCEDHKQTTPTSTTTKEEF